MIDNRDKEARKLQKCKIALMRNSKFVMWSGIMMIGDTSLSDNVPTAYTDGRNEVYGRAFVKRLPEKQLAFVILHENLHKAFRHLTTWVKLHKIDPHLANCACDYVIDLASRYFIMLVGSVPPPPLGLVEEMRVSRLSA